MSGRMLRLRTMVRPEMTSMTGNLRHKAVGAVLWSFLDKGGQSAIQAIVYIALARLLEPAEIGLIGMLWIVLSLGQTLVDSGFGQALVQKRDVTRVDECSVFYFNVLVASLGFAVLWIIAPWIGRFYNDPVLIPLTRCLGFILPISALGVVQTALLSKKLDLKTQARAGVLSTVLSGVMGVAMAYRGYGVWSLAGQSIALCLCRVMTLWWLGGWRPALKFKMSSLLAMMPFGSRLLFSGILNAVFSNLYYVIIGKLFSPQDLGYYTTANRVVMLPGNSITTVVSGVSLPVYSLIQNDPDQYRKTLKKAITLVMVVNIPLAVGLMMVADPLVRAILSEKWIPAIPYMRICCLSVLLVPLHYGNLEALLGLGRSDLYFGLELAKKALTVISIIICWQWGIAALMVGELVSSLIAIGIQTHYVGKLINYPLSAQIRDLMPQLIIAVGMAIAISLVQGAPFRAPALVLIIEVVTGVVVFIGLCLLFKVSAFMELLGVGRTLLARFRRKSACKDI